MKKILSLVLIWSLLLPLFGCNTEEAVYLEPAFTPGTLKTDRLTVEKGNYDRANRTGNGYFLEIDTGYYLLWWNCLYYAEKTNMDSWYYVCTKPNCTHSGNARNCSARSATGNGLYWKDHKLYFADSIERYSQYSEGGKRRGMAQFSMEENGDNITLEYFSENQQLNLGGMTSVYTFFGGFVQGGYFFNQDGSYTSRLILITEGWEDKILFEKTTGDQPTSDSISTGRLDYEIYGDLSIVSYDVTDGLGYSEPLCWLNEGELMTTDIAQIPAKGGYLKDNILRGFASGDGYYDTDLLTGEQTRLADAQLSDSAAVILQPNCIIETTLLNGEAAVQTQQIRFFDGEQWHEVELPEELRSAPDASFEVVALTSDSVIFSTKQQQKDLPYFAENSVTTFYKMSLEQKSYKLEMLGAFSVP